MLNHTHRQAVNVGRNFFLEIIPTIGIFVCNIFVMARNTSILLGEHFEKFIDSEVSSGRYTSASEVVRTALRMLQTEEEAKKNLISALKKGERSGIVKNFDPKKHLASLHKKYL